MNLSDAKLKKLLEKYIEKPHGLHEKKLLRINEELKNREEFRRLTQKFKIQRKYNEEL